MTQRILIRFALAEERQALEALQWRASLPNEAYRDLLLAHLDAITLPLAQIEAHQVVVAEIDDRVVGFAAIAPRDDGDIDLDGLFVEPDAWKSGIGTGLVQRCRQLAIKAGAGALMVVANPQALGFYHSCGFVVIGTTQTRFGAGTLMRLALA
ncbi:MAG: GNAT family N-acetyltransferase [Terricaulis sp.]